VLIERSLKNGVLALVLHTAVGLSVCLGANSDFYFYSLHPSPSSLSNTRLKH
jgi:hypothetical protein